MTYVNGKDPGEIRERVATLEADQRHVVAEIDELQLQIHDFRAGTDARLKALAEGIATLQARPNLVELVTRWPKLTGIVVTLLFGKVFGIESWLLSQALALFAGQ